MDFFGHIGFLAALANPFATRRVAGSQDTKAVSTPNQNQGLLIINADDWGRDVQNTDRIRDCIARGTVSSTSAMVFMEDSQRAAQMAREQGIDTGLHLNLTTAFSAPGCPPQLLEHQRKVSTHLLRHRYAKVVFHPGLIRSFEYVVSAQLDEYRRLYGAAPERLDGHHHMHLCANVLYGKLLPEGIILRRNFSFVQGEKSSANRRYREVEDLILTRHFRCTEYFYSIAPLEPKERLERILNITRNHVVEVESHPVNEEEYKFFMGDDILRLTGDVSISPRFVLPRQAQN